MENLYQQENLSAELGRRKLTSDYACDFDVDYFVCCLQLARRARSQGEQPMSAPVKQSEVQPNTGRSQKTESAFGWFWGILIVIGLVWLVTNVGPWKSTARRDGHKETRGEFDERMYRSDRGY